MVGAIGGMLIANADVPQMSPLPDLMLFGVAGALAGSCASLIFLLLCQRFFSSS
jgi:hypothetical protein